MGDVVPLRRPGPAVRDAGEVCVRCGEPIAPGQMYAIVDDHPRHIGPCPSTTPTRRARLTFAVTGQFPPPA